MSHRHIIFVPGKNPKPIAEQHQNLLWRTLVEGVARADPTIVEDLSQHQDNFKLIAWNFLYYLEHDDISLHLPWVDQLMNKHGPTEQDITDAKAWHRKLDTLLYSTVDHLPVLLRLIRGQLRATAEETNRYFHNVDKIGSQVREQLKQELRPLLEKDHNILLIGHSLGSVIAFDTLWALSQLEHLPGKIDLFLTLGSPLGMNYVQRRLMGNDKDGEHKYPTNISDWVNIAADGDVTALDRKFADDFGEMLELGVVNSIEDHCEGIYNYFHDENGLNCHRDYGYLVNPVVGSVIADWWKKSQRAASDS